MARMLLVIAVALLISRSLLAEDSLSERINARARAYEQSLDGPFREVQPGLVGWYEGVRHQAVDHLHGLMQTATGESRLFVAFHCLELDPADEVARTAFVDAKVDAPIDPQGHPAAALVLSTALPGELVQQVTDIEHPSFDVVRQVLDVKGPMAGSYWSSQYQGIQDLRRDLLKLRAEGQTAMVFQLLAYYYPDAREVQKWYKMQGHPVPTERWWIDHVDQFLIDHELAGKDCCLWKPTAGPAARKAAAGTWMVSPATWSITSVRSCRVEAILSAGRSGLPAVRLGEDGRLGGVLVTCTGSTFQAMSLPSHKVLGTGTTKADLSHPTPVEIEIRDKHLTVSVGGLTTISADLPSTCALRRFAIEGTQVTARSLRLRYLSSQGSGVVVKQAEWPDERKKQLEKNVTLILADTAVEEALVALSRSGGIAIVLDDSGQLLKDLPVTLDAKDMKLGSILEAIERQTDLRAHPTPQGITLTWTK